MKISTLHNFNFDNTCLSILENTKEELLPEDEVLQIMPYVENPFKLKKLITHASIAVKVINKLLDQRDGYVFFDASYKNIFFFEMIYKDTHQIKHHLKNAGIELTRVNKNIHANAYRLRREIKND